jgi:hypothetical protein
MSRHLNNEGHKYQAGHVKERIIVWMGGEMERVKEGEYDWGTFYIGMNMEHWNSSTSF